MKTFLIGSLVLFSSLAFADSAETCFIAPANEIVRLEQEVTIQGVVVVNPMMEESSETEPIKASFTEPEFFYVVAPSSPIMLEQWNGYEANFACRAEMVTLALDLEKQSLITQKLATGSKTITVTGKISWSDSSLAGAGNAVLFNITNIQ